MPAVKQNDSLGCWMDMPLSTNLCQNQRTPHKVFDKEDTCQAEI